MAEIDELIAAIRGAKSHDPFAAVTVAVPSNYAGLSLRRRLGRDMGGLVNVNFTTVARVAELLGAPALAAGGRRPLTKALRTEAIRAALTAAPGSFAEVTGHPSTLEALDRTFADLRSCTDAELDAIAAAGPRPADVVRLFRATRSWLAQRYYDEHDLADAAAPSDAVGRLVVYLPRRLSPAMHAMVQRLDAVVIERDRAAPPVAVHRVMRAVDPDEEVRAAVRLVMDEVRAATPLHRIALLWPVDEPYAVLAHQQFDAAAIPHNGPATRTLAHTVAGGALVQLLGLADRGFRRDEVMGWLASAPIVEVAGGKDVAPASQWDGISTAAGVIESPPQWQTRLTAHAAALTERKAALALEDDVEAWRLERIDNDIDRTHRLRAFIADVVAALQPPATSTWAAFSAWACGLLDRYLGGDAHHYRWPDAEQDAWRDVRAAVEQLTALDGVGPGADLGRFRHAVAAELAGPAARHGRFGTGVFAAHLAAARATDFDVVLVVGLAEGSLPGRRSEDPLLHDTERAAGGPGVPLRGERIDDEWDDFQAALGAARHTRVVLTPRTDPRRRRERLLSRWVPAETPVDEIESFQQGIATREPAALTDRDLRDLLEWTGAGGDPGDHPLAVELPAFGAGLVATDFRAGPEFTRYDGNVGAGLIDPLSASAPMSPTSLQDYALCPARYFYGKVLHLTAPDRPEEIRRITPLTKGSLVHEVLERFVLGVLEDPSAHSEARLFELAEEAFGDYESRGLTGAPMLWQYERESMRRELARFFDEDDDGAAPLAAELTFGHSGEEPVVLTLPDGREIGFRGTADRVDRLPSGAIRVTDYKTGFDGKYKGLEDDPVDRGLLLQLPLYGLAARARFGDDDTPVESRYWMISERSDFRNHAVPVDDDTLARLREVLGVLVDGISSGRFPARPGDEDWRAGWENCRYCDFDRVCLADRDRAWERVRGTTELDAYVALAEGPHE